MSMSQEEIEALMNGAGDFLDESSTEEPAAEVSTEEPAVEEENFDDILAGIDGITDDDSSADSAEEENFDDILAGIDGITDDGGSSSENTAPEDIHPDQETADNIEEMINQNKYPLPVEKEHKVVNQLTEVAEDSEQKASQIFDVLSYILDENNEIQSFNSELGSYLEKQNELLSSLSEKFPNVEVFKENLEVTAKISESCQTLNSRLDNENNKIFEAMELMQYHDINRQKIERVMSVIRKLNDYLNGIFEDDSDKPEVQIARHISGDSNETVDADDLEALISQYSD